MAEVSPNSAAQHNSHDSPTTPELKGPAGEPSPAQAELPESASPTNNLALNRSAEAVGRGVGAAVAGVRRLPQQFDRLRSRIHLVPKRQAAAAVSEVYDSAREAAADWRDAAEETATELKARAETYTHEASERGNRMLEDLRRRTGMQIDALRRGTRAWVETARQWEAQQPLKFVAGCAMLAFAAGVALRIWRSSHD
jgi:ElaB/YqjD/DUF883 family membrane-anchored ribosome-binding protein